MGFFGAPFKSKGAETAAGTGTRRAFRRQSFSVPAAASSASARSKTEAFFF